MQDQNMEQKNQNSLKFYKPITPGQRHKVQINFKFYLSGEKNVLKSLVRGYKKAGGRNNYGRLTAFRQGGGHKQSYRLTSHDNLERFLPFSILTSLEYDPYRSSFLGTCFMKETGRFQYILAPQNAKIGMFLTANKYLHNSAPGSPCHLYFTDIGDLLYNINLSVSPSPYRVSSAA
jgi:large subunit ribosomal protein L2